MAFINILLGQLLLRSQSDCIIFRLLALAWMCKLHIFNTTNVSTTIMFYTISLMMSLTPYYDINNPATILCSYDTVVIPLPLLTHYYQDILYVSFFQEVY